MQRCKVRNYSGAERFLLLKCLFRWRMFCFDQGMFKTNETFHSCSVNDLEKAKQFYAETLGLEVRTQKEGLKIHFASGAILFLYPKPNHEAATYTVLNFLVANIEKAVADLKNKNVKFES
jgi:predicted enzyme related to lactoylglutathione lyase